VAAEAATPADGAGEISVATVGAWVEALLREDTGEEEATQALRAVCQHAAAEEAVFAIYADRLVGATNQLLERTLSRTGGAAGELTKYLINALIALFDRDAIAKLVVQQTLENLIRHTLRQMAQEQERSAAGPGSPAGGYVLKGFNKLMSVVLDRADRTISFIVLLQLLRESAEAPEAVYTDFVMKCVLKLTKEVRAAGGETNLKPVLREVYLFLKEYPPQYWQKQSSNMPLKTVKTLLYETVALKGTSILRELTLIPTHPTPTIRSYIDIMLKSERGGADAVEAEAEAAGKPTYELTPELVAILKMVGQKETTTAGLQKLLLFKQVRHIEDLAPYLARLSDSFRNYILRSLAKLEERRKREEQEEQEDTATAATEATGENARPNHGAAATPTVGEKGKAETPAASAPVRAELGTSPPRMTIAQLQSRLKSVHSDMQQAEDTEKREEAHLDAPVLSSLPDVYPTSDPAVTSLSQLRERLNRLKSVTTA